MSGDWFPLLEEGGVSDVGFSGNGLVAVVAGGAMIRRAAIRHRACPYRPARPPAKPPYSRLRLPGRRESGLSVNHEDPLTEMCVLW
ncbi:hypothetical protein GCM10009527_076980 [Actinomadura nitritigenes]